MVVQYKTARKAKQKGYELESSNFYVTPKAKVYGLDEKNRPYPIFNTPKKLYTVGQHIVDTNDVKYLTSAPTQSQLQKWLREEYKIHIQIVLNEDMIHRMAMKLGTPRSKWSYRYIFNIDQKPEYYNVFHSSYKLQLDTYEQALEHALYHILKLL